MKTNTNLFNIPECGLSKRGYNLLAVSDQPIEKLSVKGRTALTDKELLSIIIGGGSEDDKSLVLAGKILLSCNNDLNEVARMSISDLTKFTGIGKNTAVSIITAFEIGRRKAENMAVQKVKISSSRDAFDIFAPILSDNQVEEFWVLFLNRANKIIAKRQISKGGISGTVVDPKIIFKLALEDTASSIILCHNHPSGNNQPSEADTRLTKKIKDAGNLLDIMVLDHVIIAGNAFFSFADECKL